MPIKAACPICANIAEAHESLSGKSMPCPHCGASVTFPFVAGVVPPSQPAPSFRASPTPESPPDYAFEHRIKASGGAFKLGFGIVLGGLVALFVFWIALRIIDGLLSTATVITKDVGEAARSLASRDSSPEPYRKPIAPPTPRYGPNDISVIDAEFSRGHGKPVISMQVQNHTGKVVRTVHFHGRLGASVEGDFTYSPQGGLQVDQTDNWNLEMGPGNDFFTANPVPGAELKVRITKIDFAE